MTLPLVILLYDSRSGSTYLASRLAECRSLWVSIESEFVIRVLSKYKPNEIAKDVGSLVDLIWSDPKFVHWDIEKDSFVEALNKTDKPFTVAQVIEQIFRYKTAESGSEVAIYKCGSAAFYLPAIRAAFPDVRFLHIIRDPRSVYSSKKRAQVSSSKELMADNPVTAARLWTKHARTIRNLNCGDIHTVTYESLIRNPELEMASLLQFIQPLAKTSLKLERSVSNNSYRDSIPNEQLHLHQNLGREANLERIESWRIELTPPEIDVVELFCSKEMSNWGYDFHHHADASLGRTIMILAKSCFLILKRWGCRCWEFVRAPRKALEWLNRRLAQS